MARVVAITVTFNPQEDLLRRQITATLAQVESMLLVDNGSSDSHLEWLRACRSESGGRIELLELGGNMGVGYAQNKGVARARELGSDAVLLLDHDSIPAPGMVSQLMDAWRAQPSAAALGPWHEDPRRGQRRSPFIQVRGLRQIRLPFESARIWPVDHLIASGTLIPLNAFDAVGAFREDYFIDMVDIEWCLRARRCGWGVYGVCDARLSHELGDGTHGFLTIEYTRSSPMRTYYQVRNLLSMWLEGSAPPNWLVVTTIRMSLRIVLHGMVHARRGGGYFQAAARGLRDGLRHHHGRDGDDAHGASER